MTRDALVAALRTAAAALPPDAFRAEQRARFSTLDDAAVLEEALTCSRCAGGWPGALLPGGLLDIAVANNDRVDEVGNFLCAAHCCACVQHCACGGCATPDGLTALIATFEGASQPPSPEDWWHAVLAYQALHAAHQADQHPMVVCEP